MNRLVALSDLEADQQGRIVTAGTISAPELQNLLRAGARLNARIQVMHRDQCHVLFFADSRELAVGWEIASGIYVERDK